jgi:hypothetical protein
MGLLLIKRVDFQHILFSRLSIITRIVADFKNYFKFRTLDVLKIVTAPYCSQYQGSILGVTVRVAYCQYEKKYTGRDMFIWMEGSGVGNVVMMC